ncbi:Hemicentin-2 [Stylophora pistillata]|uniref:Hemicentin-2 n=1 Tax=Stylophora pistillata TaxID=50429 RepID=A0A2B4RWY6_STYPI|nr:Hemicentin-2 [Stylophora pistillata]
MVTVLRLLTALLSMSCWKEISGLQMITQPNKTTISFIGSNQTFAWNFILTEEDKAKELKVTFAHWSNEYNMIEGDHMVTFVRKPTGNEAVYKGSLSIAKRFHWVGDMARGFVAFQLINVQAKDASDYGIRFRVDGFPPDTDESGFTLSVRDLPPSPPEPANITVRIVEGKTLNITCRARMESESSFVLWLKDNWPIKRGRKKFLFIQSIKRSQAGDYMCVSLSQDGNHSSPFTVVDVLFAPKILKPNKQVSMELTRGNSTTLKCTASANPYPALTWHTQGGEIKQGVSNTLNSSSLIVTPRNDSDFTSYMCIAKNGIGFDSVTFMLNEKAFRTTDHAKPKKTHEGATPGNPFRTADHAKPQESHEGTTPGNPFRTADHAKPQESHEGTTPGNHQFAHKKDCGTETALFWMRWLDGHSNFVRVTSFDFSKAFDSVSHRVVIDKLKKVPEINPYIVNWVINFLKDRERSVCVDKVKPKFLPVNRGVPRGTVLGPVFFTIMVNDISPTSQNALMTKYADYITCSIPVEPNVNDGASEEAENIKVCVEKNLMKLNLSESKELVIKGRATLAPLSQLLLLNVCHI